MKRIWIAVVAVALSVAVPAAAIACLNPVRIAGEKAVREIKRAEGLLKAGKYSKLRHYSHKHAFTDAGLARRAKLLEATASVREQLGREIANVSYAIELLRELRTEQPDAPLIQARLAEALLLDAEPGSHDEAKTLIEDLVTRDLIVESSGWAVAATVRSRAGDTAGRDAALERCKQVAPRYRTTACRVLAK